MPGTVAVNTTGGSLVGGTTICLTLCALDTNGLPSVPMAIAIVPLPGGGSSYSISLSNIVPLAAYVIFAAAQDDLICGQQLGAYGSVVASGALTPTGNGTTYTPGTITFTGPLQRSTFALPSPYVANLRLKAKHLIHGGINRRDRG